MTVGVSIVYVFVCSLVSKSWDIYRFVGIFLRRFMCSKIFIVVYEWKNVIKIGFSNIVKEISQ